MRTACGSSRHRPDFLSNVYSIFRSGQYSTSSGLGWSRPISSMSSDFVPTGSRQSPPTRTLFSLSGAGGGGLSGRAPFQPPCFAQWNSDPGPISAGSNPSHCVRFSPSE